jgi:predicted alpha/beta-fold hydrolase
LQREFEPLFANPHLLTIAGNFWPRKIDIQKFPPERKCYQVDAQNQIVAFEHQPAGVPKGQILFLHGLEGSADAGYIASFAQQALTRGFGVHRLNMRTCGGTEDLCATMYHSGLTADPRTVLQQLAETRSDPLFLVGFSLGGNVALKMAGELGETHLVAGVIAVSTPIDLALSVRAIDKVENTLYARRFLARLKDRIRRKCASSPGVYDSAGLEQVHSIWEFDDRFTAPLFGFGSAANYYATQSAIRFLDQIRVSTLVITAQDDPLVPFDVYKHRAFEHNPAIELIAPARGGHLGFLSRRKPRFWVDQVGLDWIETVAATISVARHYSCTRYPDFI